MRIHREQTILYVSSFVSVFRFILVGTSYFFCAEIFMLSKRDNYLSHLDNCLSRLDN